MCLEDIRLGRETLSGVTTLVLDGTDQPLLPQSMSRIALILTPPSQGVVFYHIGSTIPANQGIRLAAGDGPLILDIQQHGDLVRRAWRVRGEAQAADEVGEWVEDTQAVNAIATATHAAVAGQTHFVTHVSGAFSATVVSLRLQLLTGAVVLGEWYLDDSFVITFPSGIPGVAGDTIVATLAAGGVGVTGSVHVAGFTRDSATEFGEITVYETHLHKT